MRVPAVRADADVHSELLSFVEELDEAPLGAAPVPSEPLKARGRERWQDYRNAA